VYFYSLILLVTVRTANVQGLTIKINLYEFLIFLIFLNWKKTTYFDDRYTIPARVIFINLLKVLYTIKYKCFGKLKTT